MVWTQEETEIYGQIPSPKLDRIYGEAGIPESQPEQRAKYLAEHVLNMGMTDHDLIMRTAKKQGRHVALNMLEKMVISDD
ncbi:hypothetical protein HQ545_04355 [Candidatus Woesearchaeota archaeon]|nr:hypothetical protein [Candidatus Woesearchaeota archaeon]